MSYRRALGGAYLALAWSCAAGCGATTFDGRIFKNASLSFRLAEVPSGWRQLESDEALLAFRDDSAPASIVVNGRCGRDGDDVPLSSLTHHLFLQFSDRVIENEVKITLDGREALHTELLAKLDGVQKRFTVFVLKKNGCVYDFIHIAPPSASAESREHFVSFVQGFSTISP
jgi:predicted Zn-dependent protease